jgi:hypothetical protein
MSSLLTWQKKISKQYRCNENSFHGSENRNMVKVDYKDKLSCYLLWTSILERKLLLLYA